MKLAFDAKRIFNNSTGLGNYGRTLLDNLHQFYPEVSYHLFSPNIKKQSEHVKYAKQFKTIIPDTSFKHIWRSYSIRKDLEREKIDLYHGLSNEIPFWLKNTKALVTIHDVIFKVLPHTYPQLDRWLYEEKTRYACKYAEKIIAISEQTKLDLIAYYNVPPERIQVIYQPCQPIFYKTIEAQNPLSNNFQVIPILKNIPSDYILYVGSITERKNLLNLVKAIAQLPIVDRIPLVVVGNGKQYKKKVEEFIGSQQLQRWVYWITDLTDIIHLKRLYEGAKMLVYPSFYEGFGLPIVEAMLCATPVITSNLSALPEAGGTFATLVNPDSVEELRHAIQTLLSNTQLRLELGTKGKADALIRFDPKRLTQEVMELYRSLIDI